MAEISAQLVNKLRQNSGARMMDCKKALVETQAEASAKGEAEWLAAGEAWLRVKIGNIGAQMAEKAAAEGLLGYKASPNAITVVEMTANTDFVAKNEEFMKLLNDLVAMADANKVTSAEALNAMSLNGQPVAEAVKAIAGKIGENISVKRVVRFEGEVGYYIHHDYKQGAIVELEGVSGEKAVEIGKDIAMHVVFARPTALTREEVSQEAVQKETEIALEKLKADPKNANKPKEILEKIVQGQVNKFYGTMVLPDQAYYKENAKTVSQVLKEAGNITIKRFAHFHVGSV